MLTLHPGKEGNGKNIYKNAHKCAGRRKAEKRKQTILSPQSATVHQTELTGDWLPVNKYSSDSSHCTELYCAGGA